MVTLGLLLLILQVSPETFASTEAKVATGKERARNK
jgi:hypothetical protein